MNTMLRRTLVGALVLCPLLTLASCGPRVFEYGVVLWGETAGVPRTGAVVAVMQDPTINNTALIMVSGDRTPHEYPAGRIRMFKKKSEASDFAKAYTPNLGLWAVVVKEDSPPLPIRDAPSPDGKILMKLRYKQLVKVVSRSASQATVKPYTDYWYELATDDGSTGWCFGHFLRTFSADGDPAVEQKRILSQDEILAAIMGTTWRPGWFLDQRSKGAIDLTMFREDVGLFPSPAERLMKLVLPLSTFEFRYTGEPQKIGASSYSFPGTDLRIDVLDTDATRINVTYTYKSKPKTDLYVAMTDDVTQIIADEQKRRDDIYATLQKDGATLTSTAYGIIHLQDGMRFSWEGFGKLVPSLIGADAKGTGAMDFTLHVIKGLTMDYDGVMTFLFDEYPAAGVSFLYKITDGGIRLTSLARDSVQDLFVTHPSYSPLVIFFTQSQ
jgi:hypothetical protein